MDRPFDPTLKTLALAPISNVPESDLRRVIRRIQERLSGAKAPRRAADIWAATYVLLGLRYSDALANALFEEVLGMEQSATYQAIVRRGREEGRAEEARRLLLLLGEPKFDPHDAATRAITEGITDVARLEELALRVASTGSWQELLQPPHPRRRKSRRTEG
jgi:predicted transposase YdaD